MSAEGSIVAAFTFFAVYNKKWFADIDKPNTYLSLIT